MVSFTKHFRPWMKRFGVVGGTTLVGIVAFPHIEDAFWLRRDPHRVQDSTDSSAPSPTSNNQKKNLVILGSGWASVSVMKYIDRDKYNITLVSPRNYFLFTPLLPSVCSGTITTDSVTVPIREFTSYKAMSILDRLAFLWRGYLPDRVTYLYAAASDVDLQNKIVTCQHQNSTTNTSTGSVDTFELPYDVLVIGTGATSNTFNTKGVHEHCHFLKETGDATLIRQAILENLERASLPTSTEEDRRRLLSFWVVGGGPTAVEFAAELQDFLRFDVVNPTHATFNQCANATSVTLVQSNQDLLPGYPKKIRDFALKQLQDCNVKVITEARASKVTNDTITIYDKTSDNDIEYPYGLIVWATGVKPGPLIQKLLSKIPQQSSYRSLKTDSHCQVLGAPGVFAIGDCADIDMQAEYTVKINNLFDEAQQKYPASTQQGAGLSLDANQAFVDALKHLEIQTVSAPGAKIVKEVEQHFQEGKCRPSDQFRGITRKELLEVINKHMDRQKILPPTAQVAHQQGEYIAKLLNDAGVDHRTGQWTFDNGPAFAFRNKGQLVYVGGHMAALSVPAKNSVDVSWNGSLTNYIWHAAYFGMLESISARTELVFDWIKSYLFGRSTALDAICTSDSSNHVDSLRRGRPKEDDETKEKDQKRRLWGLF